jgi:anti-anti-sigma factor
MDRLWTLAVDLGAGVPVVRITGDMRLSDKQAVADQIRESLNSLMAAGHKRIVLSLAGVRRIDSRGIGCLARIQATAITKNTEISLVLAPGQVMDALNQLNFVKLYPIYGDEATALAPKAKGAI